VFLHVRSYLRAGPRANQDRHHFSNTWSKSNRHPASGRIHGRASHLRRTESVECFEKGCFFLERHKTRERVNGAHCCRSAAAQSLGVRWGHAKTDGSILTCGVQYRRVRPCLRPSCPAIALLGLLGLISSASTSAPVAGGSDGRLPKRGWGGEGRFGALALLLVDWYASEYPGTLTSSGTVEISGCVSSCSSCGTSTGGSDSALLHHVIEYSHSRSQAVIVSLAPHHSGSSVAGQIACDTSMTICLKLLVKRWAPYCLAEERST